VTFALTKTEPEPVRAPTAFASPSVSLKDKTTAAPLITTLSPAVGSATEFPSPRLEASPQISLLVIVVVVASVPS
jgi:hypothetical protein